MPPIITEYVPLAPYTTLKVGGKARYYARVCDTDTLHACCAWAREHQISITVISGGSNVLIADAGVDGLVIQLATAGVFYEYHAEKVLVTAAAGVVLDNLITEVVSGDLWGLENLSAIPGSVGAVPIQNVGAYGIEAAQVVHAVVAYHIPTGRFVGFTPAACEFGYRDSFFKTPAGREYIITSVTFQLTRTPTPQLDYRDLHEFFSRRDVPALSEIRDAIRTIRAQKFPDWHTVGTAGSFFKNPLLTRSAYKALQAQYPQVPGFRHADGTVKVPLGWILDHLLNKRGYRDGAVGLYTQQALVLINHGGATAADIALFATRISEEVHAATGITIAWEVTRVPYTQKEI